MPAHDLTVNHHHHLHSNGRFPRESRLASSPLAVFLHLFWNSLEREALAVAVALWLSGNVLGQINEVTLCRARLVPG